MLTFADYTVILCAVRQAHRKRPLPAWIDFDDLAQAVAEAYIKERRKGRDVRDLRGWSVRVSRNHITSIFRRTADAARLAAYEINEIERRLAVAAPDPEELVIANDLLGKMSASMPSETAIVCTPTYWDAVSRSRRHRARQRLSLALREGVLSSLDIAPGTTRPPL